MLSFTHRLLILFLLSSIAIWNSCSSRPGVEKKAPAAKPADSFIQNVAAEVSADTTARHKIFLRNNWMNLIHIKKSRSYKTGKDHTGIYGLKIEVENPLEYSIDSVIILVAYYAQGECIKSEYVNLKKIASHGSVTARVPDNASATSYQLQVRKVHSAALELCFDIDDPNRTGDDPYHCK